MGPRMAGLYALQRLFVSNGTQEGTL
jgi:hypothetical protein